MRRSTSVLLLVLAFACTAPQDDPVPAAPPGATPAADSEETLVHTNRLAHESSPYLLQHAHNPVDWYPWGEEAFEKARREGKPIFLSIGYSTCHWCHVMERESFENESIATYLNEHFVAVKVDREERPDVDAIYMTAVQLMGGRGGWPLSAFLTPELEPFFVATYFPPEDRFGRPGFRTVLERMEELWRTRRNDVVNAAREAVAAVREHQTAHTTGDPEPALLDRAADQFRMSFDPVDGGFSPAPKFPRSFALSFLLARSRRGDAAEIVPMVERTLDRIAQGGIHDHLGGGFHRYSTDAQWLVPHFEKMLYDQAFLARAFLDGWQVTGEERHAQAARGIFEYVLRDLRDPAGGFHSAEDADSEGVEGKFYVWTREEIDEVLGAEDGALFAEVYGCTAQGNFLDEATHTRTGANIPHLDRPLDAVAADRGADPAQFAARMASLRGRLLQVRSARIRPHLDDKVLADWNGMMISALARGGAELGEERFVDAAREAAAFVLSTLRTGDGLLHRYRAGQAGIDGFLDDYAFVVIGLADLYEATFDEAWLREAKVLAHDMVERFRDEEAGGFHLAQGTPTDLVARTKELYDGAVPSGNSAAILALVRVGRLTGDEDLLAAARRGLRSWSGTLTRHPMSHPYCLAAFDLLVGPSREIVVAGPPDDERTRALLQAIRSRFTPDAAILLHPPGAAGAALREIAPFVTGKDPVGGVPAVHVCEAFTCAAPVTSVEETLRLLDAAR